MAGLDSVTAADNTQTSGLDAASASRLSQEGNPGPDRVVQTAAATAPADSTLGDRGHTMHAGGENTGMPVPPPRLTTHQNEGTTTGIDVSEFQKTIDWHQVQGAGVKFAYIRATDGTTIQDATFAQNWKDAEKEGVLVGPYHYFTTTSPVATQITNFVNTVKQVDSGNLPPVLDVEDPAQFAKFTVPERVAMIQQWLDGVQKELGVKPMIYMSSNFSGSVLNNAKQFDSYRLWVADDTTAAQPIVPQPWTNWDFWQHADNGKVPGITDAVDLDLFNGPATKLPVIEPTTPAPTVTPKV
jgi:lysozyme